MLLMIVGAPRAWSDAAQAKDLFKAMSDYLAKQTTMSFDLDTSLDIVTTDNQRLSLASSGSVTMVRPDKIHIVRHGGFADTELYFNGQTVVLFRKDENKYAKVDKPGTIEDLATALRDKIHRPLPAADLLAPDVFDAMMTDVTDVKDLGTGYIRGIECDHLAFRTDEVDWQIWIARGDRPYPVRVTFTSKKVPGSPQYQLDISNFKTGEEVAKSDFDFVPPQGAQLVQPSDLRSFDELPDEFKPQQEPQK